MNTCLNCGKEVKNKYCNSKCRNKHSPTKYIPTIESINKQKLIIYNRWKTFNVKCSKCFKEIKIREYNVETPKKDKYFCSRSCANSRKHSNETKIKISKAIKKYGMKYIPTKNIIKITKICPICKNEFNVAQCNSKKIYCSKKCYNNDIHCKFRRTGGGGYRKGSGRGKSGWYMGYWCDSSYELAFVVYNIEHEIIFERNKEGFEYFYENKKHLYYPDFIVDNKYYEIKGYDRKQDTIKYLSISKPLIILHKNELREIISYVENKYGKNYIEIYEGNPYNEMINHCKICGNLCKAKSIYCSRQCAGKGNNKYSVWK